MTQRIAHDEVSNEITATPEAVYALVSDITRMGDWSPECIRCSWSKGATGPEVGARFKATNKGRRGPAWFDTPTVTVADPGHEFAFNRNGPGIGSYTWHYRMEPTATGTRVTESFDAARPLGSVMTWITEKWTGSADRDADLHRGMTETLARLKAEAERT
jgi:carbon monoxide dehydrogenase subunit G